MPKGKAIPKTIVSDEALLDATQNCSVREAARKLGLGESGIRGRLQRIKERGCTRAAQEALLEHSGTREKKHRFRGGNSIQELFDNHGVKPDNVKMTSSRIAEHGVVITDRKTGIQRLDVSYLKSSSFRPTEELPKWPLIQPAPQRPITYTPKVELTGSPRTQRVFLWPDTQIGFYRSVQTGQLTPMHDLAAIDVALQMLRAFRPTRVVILGDLIDLAMLSRWLQTAEFAQTLQPAIYYTGLLLGTIRSIVGEDCKIDYLAGNHERRMAEYVAKNAKEASEIRCAITDPTLIDPITLVPKSWAWPQWSIPNLLQLDHYGIEYSAEYPGGEVWLNDRNVCTHPPE